MYTNMVVAYIHVRFECVCVCVCEKLIMYAKAKILKSLKVIFYFRQKSLICIVTNFFKNYAGYSFVYILVIIVFIIVFRNYYCFG